MSAFRLFKGNEDWGIVWMSEKELEQTYKWNGKFWQHKTEPQMRVRAA